MTKKDIKKLVLSSYTKDKLDITRVNKITKHLGLKDLKLYIKFLKAKEKENTVIVSVSDLKAAKDIQKDITSLFSGKKVQFREDKSLIAGIRIVQNDVIYEDSLKGKLENLVNFINQ